MSCLQRVAGLQLRPASRLLEVAEPFTTRAYVWRSLPSQREKGVMCSVLTPACIL